MTTNPNAKRINAAAGDTAPDDQATAERRSARPHDARELPAAELATGDDALTQTVQRPLTSAQGVAPSEHTSLPSTPAHSDEAADVDNDDHDDTVIAQATPRPRTLSAAIKRPADENAPDDESALDAEGGPFDDAIEDELDPEEEWAVADQPTIYLPPKRQSQQGRPNPGDQGWPYRPASRPRPGAARPATPPTPTPIPTPTPRDVTPIPTARSAYGDARLATPTGSPMPGTPPEGVAPAALPNPRMERFQRLRESRVAHNDGQPAPGDMRPVSTMVRQWWNDLAPGLAGALRHQHEAQSSGVHPLPAYEPAPTSKLGDAFGRVAQSARELTDRARPALERIHDRAEHAAQAIVGRFEQPAAVQQAPFLGPGRIAVFFRPGVTVGQAHALLMKRQARPMRLIPRKHGFLAAVAPGRESAICDGLRNHPYVRDVAFIEYDGSASQPG
ncbi:MAG: hypothetical protein ACHQ4H_06780 [Ktedonobacterales bacterium]